MLKSILLLRTIKMGWITKKTDGNHDSDWIWITRTMRGKGKIYRSTRVSVLETP